MYVEPAAFAGGAAVSEDPDPQPINMPMLASSSMLKIVLVAVVMVGTFS